VNDKQPEAEVNDDGTLNFEEEQPFNSDLLTDPRYRTLWQLHVVQNVPMAQCAAQLQIHRVTGYKMLNKIFAQAIPPLSEDQVTHERNINIARIKERQKVLNKRFLEEDSKVWVDEDGNKHPDADSLVLARLNGQMARNDQQLARLQGTLAPAEVNVTGVAADPVNDEMRKARAQLERINTPADVEEAIAES